MKALRSVLESRLTERSAAKHHPPTRRIRSIPTGRISARHAPTPHRAEPVATPAGFARTGRKFQLDIHTSAVVCLWYQSGKKADPQRGWAIEQVAHLQIFGRSIEQ